MVAAILSKVFVNKVNPKKRKGIIKNTRNETLCFLKIAVRNFNVNQFNIVKIIMGIKLRIKRNKEEFLSPCSNELASIQVVIERVKKLR